MTELTDCRLVIIGRKGADSYSPGYPNWILLSPSGEVIGDHTDLSDRRPHAVVATADGGWTVLETDGRLVRFGASGDLRWAETDRSGTDRPSTVLP